MNSSALDIERKTLKTAKMALIDNEQSALDDYSAGFKNLGIDNISFYNSYDEFLQDKNSDLDIVISDFKMPNKDGIEVLEEIRQQNSTIKLALLTGYVVSSYSNEFQRCQAAGIEILYKLNDFEINCSNLGSLLNRKYEQKEIKDIPKNRHTFNYFVNNVIDSINKKFGSTNMVTEELPSELVSQFPARIISLSSDRVICECVINAKKQKTQIREFPTLLFNHIPNLEIGLNIEIKVILRPGISVTEINLKDTDVFDEYFKIDWNSLNDFPNDQL